MTNENIEITVAQIRDLAEILDLQKRAFVTEAEAHGNYDIEPLRQTYDSIVTDFASHTFLKAVCGGVIVGSVKYRAMNESVWVGRLIVDIARRGRGLGKRLLSEVERLNPDATRFVLFTAALSIHNIQLYESVGYRVTRQYIDEGQEGFPMVEMIKEKR